MSEIPRSLLDQLTKELNAFSSVGQQMIMNALSNAEWSDVSELRAIMVEVMEMVCGEMTDMAAARAAEFYDDVRTAAVGNKFGALAESVRESAATEGAVKALIQSVVDTGLTDRFTRELTDRVDYEIKKASGDCMAFNAERDPLKPRFARVPAGAETCKFCIMLASRGFVYRSKESASGSSHYHPNCDCRIVPGFFGMDVEGYDTAELYQRHLNNVEAGFSPQAKVGGAKKKKWESAKFESYGDFSKFVGGAEDIEALQQRCETAAAEWKKTTLGEKYWGDLRREVMVKRAQLDDRGFGAIYEKSRSSLEEHEKKGVDWLVKNGIRPTVKQEDPKARANIDFEINGQPWEMKNVSNAKGSVGNQLSRARKKFYKYPELEKRYVFTCEGSTCSFDEIVNGIEVRLRAGEGAIILGSEGEMRRIEK